MLGLGHYSKGVDTMRLPFMLLSAVLLLSLGACSKKEEAPPAPSGASESSGSTSLSIDTDSGAVSYEEQDGGNSTSISIGDCLLYTSPSPRDS